MTTPGVVPGTSVISSGQLQQLERRIYLCPRDWCTSAAKRIFDLVFASIFLICALPFMLLASLAALTSPGPLFFASERVGQGGRPIRVFKFRTMYHRKQLGLQLTCRGDGRVTRAGQFLRKWKLDELPQFINVLRGDMSLVGPRPDTAEFLKTLSPSLRAALVSIRPGITSVATLMFRNEEDLLGRVQPDDLTAYYTRKILPEKVWTDLEYACQATILTDLKVLLQTLFAILG